MPHGEVHWHEGMFLRQHQFLTEHRQLTRLMHVHQNWALHHDWGLRSIDLSTLALSNYRFDVRSLRARLRDGTVIEVPEEGPLPPIDLKPALERNRQVTVYLAVPVLRSGHPNLSTEGPKPGSRYYLETAELEDENRGLDPQPVGLRRLHLRLLLSTENLAGYEVIPLARVERSDRPEATPQLDPNYIPPVLACDAWKPLQTEILQDVYDRVGRKIEKLAGQAVSRNLALESTGSEAILTLAQLRELNEAYAVLTNLSFVEGVHPLPAYLELCRLVGQLAVFGTTRRTPPIPRYNHDDLGGCFHGVKKYLDDLLQVVPEPDYQVRPFVGRGLRLEVEMDRVWLDQKAPMFIGVRSPLEPGPCAELIGQIDMKVGSPERIENIYRLGERGLVFAQVPERELPTALPKDKGLTYFQINREQQQAEWKFVETSLTLAVRFNEHRIVGSMDGLDRVILRLNTEMPFRFELFVLTSRTGG